MTTLHFHLNTKHITILLVSKQSSNNFWVLSRSFISLIRHGVFLIKLLETNIFGVLPEALSAHVQVVLADHSMSVRAGTAVKRKHIWIKIGAQNNCMEYNLSRFHLIKGGLVARSSPPYRWAFQNSQIRDRQSCFIHFE